MSGQSTASKLAAARRRIAELEAEVARLEAQLATRRDPASTTGGSHVIRSRPDCPPPQEAAASVFGFGPPSVTA